MIWLDPRSSEMTLKISDKTRKLLDEELRSGQFQSADELLYAALEAFHFANLDEETLRELREAEAEADRSETVPWSEVRAQFMAKHLKK
jgi:Arc/MetJ-type ribon-helix-helix transcriptional regulator